MPLSSASSLANVQNAYDDNACYAEVGSINQAHGFITACRLLLRRLPKRVSKGGRIQGEENRTGPAAARGPDQRGQAISGRGLASCHPSAHFLGREFPRLASHACTNQRSRAFWQPEGHVPGRHPLALPAHADRLQPAGQRRRLPLPLPAGLAQNPRGTAATWTGTT